VVRFRAAARGVCLLQSVLTVARKHPATYSVGTGGAFPGTKQPGREVDCFRVVTMLRMCAAIPPLPHIRGQLQNQPPIGWLIKYKIENTTLLYGTAAYIIALLLHTVVIHI
jgi:hypothetical protein